MNDQLTALEMAAGQAAGEAGSELDLQQVRVRFLGRKGELTALMKGMGGLPAEQRPIIGALANEVKDRLEALFNRRLEELRAIELQQRLAGERIDVTLPGR